MAPLKINSNDKTHTKISGKKVSAPSKIEVAIEVAKSSKV